MEDEKLKRDGIFTEFEHSSNSFEKMAFRQKRSGLNPAAGFAQIGIFIVLAVLVVGGGVLALKVRSDQQNSKIAVQPSDNYAVQDIPLDELVKSGSVGLSTIQSLSVNGQLRANNSLVLAPTDRPTQGTIGQLYYDKDGNVLAYFDGTKFVDLAGTDDVALLQTQLDALRTNIAQIPETPSVPDDIALQTGNNTFTGTNTFTGGLNGVNLALSGAASLQGTLTVNGATTLGSVSTSSLVVSGSTTLGPTTISSLVLSSPLSVASGGTGATSLTNNGILIGQGTGAVTTVSSAGPGLCLVSTAGAPSFQACPGGGGAVVDSLNGLTGALTIANASGVGSTITINDATTAAKGIASFNATNFSVSSGAVNTIQDIAVTSSPTFAGLTLNGALTVGSNSIVTSGSTISSSELDVLDGGIAEGEVTGVITDVAAGTGLTGGAASGNATVNVASANGAIVVNADNIAFTLQPTGDALSATTSSGSGLEILTSGLSLLQGCSDGQILKWNETSDTWGCAADAGGSGVGDDTLVNGLNADGANFINTVASGSSAGLTWNLNTTPAPDEISVTISNASATEAGVVTTGVQSFAGDKTYNNTVTVTGLFTANGGVTIQTGDTFTFNGDAFTDLSGDGLTVAGGVLQAALGTSIDSSEITDLTITGGDIANDAIGDTQLAFNTGQHLTVTSTPTFAGVTLNGNLSLGTNSITTGATTISSTELDVLDGGLDESEVTGVITDVTAGNGLTGGSASGTATLNVTSANGGIAVSADNIALALQPTADALSTTISSGSGLEILAGGLSLLQGCSDAQVLKWNESTDVWECASDGTGGNINGSGSTNRLAKFSGAQAIGDSSITDDGTTVTTTVDLVIQGGNVTAGTSSQLGSFVLHDGNGQTTTLQAGDSAGDLTLTLPNAAGSQYQCLKYDTGGQLIWDNCEGGSSGSGGVTSLNTLTGDLTIQGNAQIAVNATSPNVSLSIQGDSIADAQLAFNTGQHLTTTSTPTFAGLALNGDLTIGTNNIVTGATTISSTELDVLDGGITEGEVTGVITDVTAGNGLTGGAASGNATLNITSANGGIVVNADNIALTLQPSGDALSATTSSGSGLEILSGGFALLQGCGDGQVLKWNEATDTWSCSDDAGGSGLGDDISVNGSAAGNANFINTIVSGSSAGVTWNLNTTPSPDEISITISNASATDAGVVTTGVQSFSGAKTFSSQITADGGINLGTQTLQGTTAAIDFTNFDVLANGNTTVGGTLTVTGTTALNDNVTVAAGKSLTLTGGNTASRPASPSEGMLYFDSDTDRLIVYSNGKWQADRTSVTKTVAPSGAAQHIKDSADYVGDGTADEVEINQALSAAAGGKVYLFEGTFTTADTISVPNDTTLVGTGKGTLIQFGNLGGVSKNMITNTTTGGSGTGIAIRDLKLDGNKAVNSTDTFTGIYLDGVGSSSTNLPGATIANVSVQNFENNGINLINSANNIVTGNTIQSNDDYGIFTNNVSHDIITGNTITSNTLNGIYLSASSREVISTNVIASNGNYGIRIDAGSSNTISDNILRSNTGSTATSSILVTGGAGNEAHLITGNNITDTAGTGFAIEIADAAVDNVYLSNNTYSGTGASSISDASGGDTTYGGQVSSAGNFMIQPAGTIELMKDTNVTGALSVTGNGDFNGSLTIGNADQFVISNTGVVTSGTWQGGVIQDAYVANDITISASGTVDWSALNNYPAACSAGQAITQLGDSITCSAFATGTGNDIQNQFAGAQSSSEFWISGRGRADTAFITPALRAATDSTTAIQIQNAAGSTNILTVDTTNARIGIGTTPSYKLHVADTTTANSGTSNMASYVTLNVSPSSAPAAITTYYASQTLNTSSSANLNGNVTMYGDVATVQNAGNATLGAAVGMGAVAQNAGTGVTTNAIGGRFKASNIGSGSITNGVALQASTPEVTAGSIGTAYGLLIETQDVSGVGTGYGIWQAGANDLNVFAGKVGIGVIPSTYALEVIGGASVQGNITVATTAGNTLGLGNSTGALTVNGNSSSTFVINGITVDATEFNVLDGGIAEGEVTGVITDVTAGTGLTGGAASGNATVNVVSANGGIVVNADNIALTLQPAGDGLSSTTSSGSGLEILAGGFAMLQGCADNQILKWNETTDVWACGDDAGGSGLGDDVYVNGGVSTNANFINTVASGTSASVTWNLNTTPSPDEIAITIGNASATEAGAVTTGAQTFAGAKTFNNQIAANGGINLGAQTIQGTSAVIDFTNFDVLSNGSVTVGGTLTVTNTATFNENVTVAAGKSLTLTGSASRPGSPTNGMLYYDTSTQQLLVYGNGKWQADRSDAIIVAASDSSTADRDAADYALNGNTVAAGDGDQIELNTILSANPGKKIVLLAGTYVADATILVPNNTTLAGVGKGTLIELADLDASDNLLENSDTSTGTGITIRDLRLDGRKDLNSAGTQRGISFSAMGGGTGSSARMGAQINNVTVTNFRSENILLSNSSHNTITNTVVSASSSDGLQMGTGSLYNVVTGSKFQGNTSNGLLANGGSSNNTITGNNAQGNSNGFHLANSTNSTVSGNTSNGNSSYGYQVGASATSNTYSSNSAQGNTSGGFNISGTGNTFSGNSSNGGTNGFNINANNNTLTGNTVQGATQAIQISSDFNTVTGNTVNASTTYGIYLTSANNNSVSSNRIYDTGGATSNNGIYLTSSSNNTFTDNAISDTSATTTNYAINITTAASATNTLAGNILGGGSINDGAPTTTLYGGQVNDSGNYLLQPSGSIELLKNTNVTGNVAATGTLQGTQLISTVSTGTAPLTVSSTTLVANLNSDLLDGQSGSFYQDAGNINAGTLAVNRGGTGAGTFTQYGILFGNGTGAFGVTAAGTTGQCLLATTSAAPTWGTCTPTNLQGTYDASSPATINLTNNKDFTINAADTATDSSIVFNLQCTTCSASGGRFAIQDAGVDIFTINPNGDIIIGTATNNVTFVASNGYKPTASGTARNSKKIRLHAEYPSVVLTADGSNNLGTLTSGYDNTGSVRMNYYNWTTTQGSNQDYDIVVQVPLPSDFNGWDGANPLAVTAYTSNTTNGTITLEARDSSDAQICNFVSVTPGSTGTWATNNTACTLSTGTYTAGDYITLRIKLQAPNAGNTRVGNITLNYLSKF